MTPPTRRALVIGGGVGGLSSAIELRRRGWEVRLWEAQEALGGMMRPFQFRGVRCDLGSHRLHASALEEPLLRELAPELGLATRRRNGRIVLGGRHIPYPLRLGGLLRGLGPRRAAAFCAGAAWERRPRLDRWETDRTRPDAPDEGFERFVVRRVGWAAYDGFYRPYAEKVWGIPPSGLSRTVAKKRVSTARPTRHLLKRAAGTFLYPQRGMSRLVSSLAACAHAAGVDIDCGRSMRAPSDATGSDVDLVLHSGYLKAIAPETTLDHLGLYLVFLALPTSRLGDVDTWYVPEGDYWFGRVSEVGNFSEQPGRAGETVICVEIPEGAWGREADFEERLPELREQLERAGILPRGLRPSQARQMYMPNVYPMYRRGWTDTWTRTLHDIAGTGRVMPVGRQGLFLHCNIDHCMRVSRAAAEHLERGGSVTDWPRVAASFLDLRVRD